MLQDQEFTALENHLRAVDNNKITLNKYISQDKRKKQSYFLQLGKATISPALKYNEMNHFILGMSRAKQIIQNK
jgi:hypothetical protein